MKDRIDNLLKSTIQLAEFVQNTNYDTIPENVINRAKLIVADTVGVTIKGSLEPEMQRLFSKYKDNHGVTLLTKNFPKAQPLQAAVFNATATCFLELDEGSRPTGHPSLHVLPSTLSFSQMLHKSGKDFITAFIVGYEVQYRIQKATKLRKNVHPHGNFGHAGAIAAIGKLLEWDTEKIRQGINSAVGLAGGTSWKPCLAGATVRNAYPALTAYTAFFVKDIIESGFVGYDYALSETFGEILGEDFTSELLIENLASEYGVLNNYFKFHAACALTHPVLDAVSDAVKMKINHGKYPPIKTLRTFIAQEIKEVNVKVAQNAVRLDVNAAPNQLSAKFSIPYAVAAILSEGHTSYELFKEPYLSNNNLQELQKKVKVMVDDNFSKEWPKKAMAEVRIHLINGEVLMGKCLNPFGSVKNQPIDVELKLKFSELTNSILSEEQKEKLWDSLLNVNHFSDINKIFFNL
jgi:2-methylcitrate dehydratase PrpD